MKLSVLLAGVLGASVASAADTWWVDDDNYGKSGDGKTEAAAFGTIQEAVEKAETGDTIKVKPGTYDQGKTWDGTAYSRLVITNKYITVKSTDGKEVTEIVGRHSDTGSYGDDAIRCIFANASAGTVRIEGFTIRDGQAPENTSASAAGMGGGLYAVNYNHNVHIVDCTIANCWASRGAGLCGGCAIRTLIVGNKNLYAHGAIATSAALYNCVGTGCTMSGQPALQGCYAVNCTFFGNYKGGMASSQSLLRNCLFTLNEDTPLGGGPYIDLRGTVLAGPYDGTVTRDHGLENFAKDVSPYQMLAPLAGDLRPTKGSAASTNGVADIMYESGLPSGVPVEADRYLDFYGNPIPKTGRICAGAVQEVAPEPVGGAITLHAGKGKLFGYPVLVSTLYIRTATYPELVHLTPDMFVGGTNIYAYNLGALDIRYRDTLRSPMMDDSFYVMPPPDAGASQEIQIVPASMRYYVNPDPDVGDDDNNDGLTPETPFRTLQKAVDSVPVSTYATVIAAAGLYGDDQGTREVGDSNGTHPTRVVVPANTFIRIKGAGKGLSVIEGKADLETKYYGGCGPKAVRCVSFAISGVLQGFSLHNGFSGWNGDTAGMSLSSGGSVLGETYTLVSDCVISNSAAARGAVNGGGYSRCEFYDCTGWNTGARATHFFSSCQLVGCCGTGAGSFIYSTDTTCKSVVHCSIHNYSDTAHNTYGGGRPIWNCAVWKGAAIAAADSMAGCVFYGITSITAEDGYTVAYPLYVAARDLRPMAGSPLETAGAKPTADNFGASYWKYVTTDLHGRTWKLNADGAPMVGCYARAVTRVEPSVQSLGTISPAGTTALEDGESLTFTYTPDATHGVTRPYLGIAVNGVVVTSGTSYTVTAPGADEDPLLFNIQALSSTNWYVNANAATYDGDGFTPETAKKRLCDIMACDLLSGDCIHAAAGHYNEGAMSGHLGPTAITSNRVEIAAGISLVSDEGPEVTFIHGKQSDSPFGGNAPGRGPGAMRAVWLDENATLRGFTVIDGTTATLEAPITTHPDNLDHTGGGVYAVSSGNSMIVDCVITNNSANRSGGTHLGYHVNCRFYQNASVGASQGDANTNGRFFGCYFGKQKSSNSLKGGAQYENCTFESITVGQQSATCTHNNNLYLGTTAFGGTVGKFRGCVFSDTVSKGGGAATSTFEDCNTYPAADLALDANHVPARGSKAINAAQNGLVPAALGGVDAAGNPRISNVTVDAGAYEYDWRPDYAAALGVGVTVETASPGVTLDETTGKVKLVDGAALTGTWPAQSETRRARYAVTAAASGEGTLSGELVCEGKVDESFALADASETRKFRATGADIDFAFGFAGEGYGLLSDFSQEIPGALLFIR